MINKNLTLATVYATTILFIGCGSSDSNSTEVANDYVTLGGNVADGYLVGAKVCLDKNSNSKCDSDEPKYKLL